MITIIVCLCVLSVSKKAKYELWIYVTFGVIYYSAMFS